MQSKRIGMKLDVFQEKLKMNGGFTEMKMLKITFLDEIVILKCSNIQIIL